MNQVDVRSFASHQCKKHWRAATAEEQRKKRAVEQVFGGEFLLSWGGFAHISFFLSVSSEALSLLCVGFRSRVIFFFIFFFFKKKLLQWEARISLPKSQEGEEKGAQ